VETQESAEAEGSKLYGESDVGQKPVKVTRSTIGAAAEGTLASMLPYINVNGPLESASNVSMAGDAIARQRAVKLILQNKRQGLCLAAGSGKTIVGLGAFTEAHAKGDARRGLFVVPSNIVGQFGSEMYKFVDPAAGLRWHADPGASAEERRAAHADPNTHMVVTTPEALREDVTHAVAQHLGVTHAEAIKKLEGSTPAEVDGIVHTAMQKKGWDYGFSMFDEFHRLLNRAGKPDSHMGRIGDSVGRMTPYYIASSADPVKSDASEVFDVLHKIAPDKYGDDKKEAFLRRHSRNTLASGLALQREMAPYTYSAAVNTGVTHDRIVHNGSEMDLTPDQQKSYDAVDGFFRAARKARKLKDMPALVEAMKGLSPESFTGGEDDEATAVHLSKAMGTLREAALNRVVNLHPDGVKTKWVMNHLEKHPGTPTLIFAHNIDAVKVLSERLKKAGHRVATITGTMTGQAKDKAKLAFSPTSGQATADVLVSSDAGAMGANMQRGSTLINYDTPMTAMNWEQRIAREVRSGQKNHVTVHDLVANADYDARNRRRLERKSALRELMTTPAESIDDSGLAMRLQKARARAFQKSYAGKDVG